MGVDSSPEAEQANILAVVGILVRMEVPRSRVGRPGSWVPVVGTFGLVLAEELVVESRR